MTATQRITIEYPNGSIDGAAYVTFLDDSSVRFDMEPWAITHVDKPIELRRLPRYGDIAEVEKLGEDSYRFVRVLRRARFRRRVFILNKAGVESPKLDEVLRKVIALGGYWERIFGGVLLILLPRDCAYDPTKDIQSCRS